MSPQKLKKRLQKDLRAKRRHNRSTALIGCLLLTCLLAGGAAFWWYKQRPAALMQQGVRFEQLKDRKNALNCYAWLFDHYADSPQAAIALYRSGRIRQYDLGEVQRALLLYLRLEYAYPQSPYVILAQKEAAELTKYRLNDCEQAIPIYQRLIEQSKQNGDRYLNEIADCYVHLKNWSQAAIEFESLLTGYPQSKLRESSSYRLADAWLLSGQRKKARSSFKQIVRDFSPSPLALEARFRLAQMLEGDEQLQAALRAYSALTRYPQQKILKQKILRLKKRMARKKKVL